MKATVLKVSLPTVYVDTSAGVLAGIWVHDKIPAEKGRSYSVELDVNKHITNSGFTKTENKRCCSNVHNDLVELSGKVEFIEEDGIVVLRLARDCLVMIEFKSQRISVGDYLVLKLKTHEITITPIGG